jgi:hypothetical protein
LLRHKTIVSGPQWKLGLVGPWRTRNHLPTCWVYKFTPIKQQIGRRLKLPVILPTSTKVSVGSLFSARFRKKISPLRRKIRRKLRRRLYKSGSRRIPKFKRRLRGRNILLRRSCKFSKKKKLKYMVVVRKPTEHYNRERPARRM